MRVRKGLEENANKTNRENIDRINNAIRENIDNYDEQLKLLEEE